MQQRNPFDQFDTAPAAPQVIIPVSPTEQRKTAIDINNAQLSGQRTAQQIAQDQQAAPLDAALKRAQLAKAQADAAAAAIAQQKAASTKAIDPAVGLQRAIDDMRRAYAAGPGATHGFSGLMDYLPTQSNKAFDRAASAARGYVGPALGLTASQLNSPGEIEAAIGPYIPTSSDYDANIVRSFDRLQGLANDQRARAGYVAPTAPVAPPGANGVARAELEALAGAANQGGQAVAAGATRTERDPVASAMVDRMIRNGKSVDDTNRALAAMGLAPVDAGQFGAAQAYHRKNPGYKGSFGDITRTVDQSALEQASGSPFATGVTSATDAATGGVFSALTGTQDRVQAMQAANPTAGTIGTIVGGVAGSAGIEGGLGRFGTRIASPFLRTAVSNPITADAIYGGVSGLSAGGGDPVQAIGGVASGVGGGMFGRGATRTLGRATRGVRDESVRYLADRGVPLTVGQVVGNGGAIGRTIKGIEDRLTSIPFIGDQVNARRLEGFRDFNRAAFDQGLAPIQATTAGAIGETGVDAARNLRSQAYANTLDPVTLQADAPFMADYGRARIAGQRLPEDMSARANYTLDRAIENVDPAGNINGRGVQQAMRRFRRETSNNAPLPNGYDFGEVMGQGEDAFTGMLARQSPETLPALNAANAANRNVEVLRDAVTRARNGTRVGEAGIFAPSQLADAAAANARRFGNGNGTTEQPFFALARAGQNVLPSRIGDSGTTTRLAGLALPGALAGGGAAAGYVGGDTDSGLAVGGLLAAGGTRVGQRALTAALTNRPASAVRIGDRIYRLAPYGGMFGAGIGATLPALLAPQAVAGQ